MEYSADHSAGVSPSTPPVTTPAADTPDVGISASSSASDSGAPEYLNVGAVIGGDKLEAASICTQLGTPLDPKSIPVSAPHGTPPPAPGELLQDVQMAEQTTAAEDEIKAVVDAAAESAVPHLVPDGPNAIVVDEPNPYTPAPSVPASTPSFTPNAVPFPAASDSTEDLPPPAKRARKNSGPTESSRLSPHYTNGHVNGDTASSSTTPAPFTLSSAQHRFAVSTLKAMKKLKDAGPFLAPVDYVAFNIPHYPNIIKHPMDISTVERKLTASNPLKPQVGLERYNNVDEFAADVRLIFANCATFNGLEHPVTIMGKRVEAVFDKQMKQMPANEDVKPVVPKAAPAPAPPPPPPKKVAPPARRPSTSVPTIRRSDAEPPQGSSVRPKREIHPPPPKDLPYADAPKKGRMGRGGKRRRDDGTHEQLKFCSRLVNDLYKKQYYNIASPFYDPVDWVKLDLPTYPKIVKKPMDMSTIRKKLDTNEYTDAGQVHRDFLLMFTNCFDFNPRGNPVNTAGQELQAVFLDKWQSLPPLRPHRESEDEEEEESDDEQARTIAMMESQIETMRSSITALKKKPKKDRKSRHAGGASGSSKNGFNKSTKNGKKKHHYQRDDDVLTFEQKKALSEAIQTLEGLPLEKVISIIHEGVPEIRDSTEEIELDIDSLPATVLHKLYVEVLKPKPVKSHRGGLGARSISGGVKRKSMDEDAETEKIRLLEDKMKLFTSGGVSYGEGDDSGSASDSSSDSDSASDGSDD